MGQSPSKQGSVNIHLSNALEFGSNNIVFSATHNTTLTIDESYGNALSFAMSPDSANPKIPYIDGITLGKNTICILWFRGTAGEFTNTIMKEHQLVSGNEIPTPNNINDILKNLPINGDGNDKSIIYKYSLIKIDVKSKVENFDMGYSKTEENTYVIYIFLLLIILYIVFLF
jgi:hypothetical protein